MRFDDAVEVVLKYEGGYVNDPNDKGGETNFGISKAAYPTLDIKNLTKEDAKKIYRINYWDQLRLEAFPQRARLIVFDAAVNQGQTRAIMMVQRTLGVSADGSLGKITLMAFANMTEVGFIKSFAARRLQSYMTNPQWDRYGKGWVTRLLDVSMYCLA
jgi:lysozyme family protein